MQTQKPVVFARYWGSQFKSARQVDSVLLQFGALQARGWNCYLIIECEPRMAEWRQLLEAAGIGLVYTPRARGNYDWRSIRAIRAICRRLECDVFQCDNMHTSPLLGAFLARVPARIWYKRSMNAYYEACRPPGFKDRLAISTRLSCLLSTSVVAISSAVRDELLSLGAPHQKVFVHNNPRPEWEGRPEGREETRRALGYIPDDIVVLAVGRAEPVKAWDLLVPAFAEAAPAASRARLLLAGSNTSSQEKVFMQRLNSLIDHYGLQSRVQFTGHVSEVRPLLAAADIFVMPSRSEGCSNALVEGLAAGLPCIATKVGSAEELLHDHPAGRLMPRNDVTALAKELGKVIMDERLREEMTAAARVPAHILSREQHAGRLADYFDSLVPPRITGSARRLTVACSRKLSP